MKHALLLLLLAIGFREQPVAHQAPAQQTRPGCNYAYWSYYPAYTHQQHGTYGYAAHYPSVLPYPYPLPLPPPPPLPPHSPGPWIPGPSHPPVPPPPPAPKNVDPFPGKFLGMGSVRYVNGARDVELICNLQGDKIVSVRTLIR
ncbi:root nodule extensin, putative [Ixodes scapularis]|uniref:Root nodule extensin, putative n=1 Tax=Ixodes scapularis TaxID=6945 RepID=B7PZL0_IXOSC|nr:root nodule extensin, putative [Ixodes scapularis]|eukprot:XP_002405449.1 root nodule extensin, putative [Ixodes scapularis]